MSVLKKFISKAHLFHQFKHDDTVRLLSYGEHLICCLFLALGNMVYVVEGKMKEKHRINLRFQKKRTPLYTAFPIVVGGFYYALY